MSPYVFINCFLKIEMINLIKSANKIPIIYTGVQENSLVCRKEKCPHLLHVSVIKYPDKGTFRGKGLFSSQFWIIDHGGGQVTAEACSFCMYFIHIRTDSNESMQVCLIAQLSPSFQYRAQPINWCSLHSEQVFLLQLTQLINPLQTCPLSTSPR